MAVADVRHVGTNPLQGEDFGEDQHDSGRSLRGAPGADRARPGTPRG